MRPLLVLRPEPASCATAAAARAAGHEVVVAPLFRVRAMVPDPAPSANAYDALLLTSANAARMLPAWAEAGDTAPPFPRGMGGNRGEARADDASACGTRVPGLPEPEAADWFAPFRTLPVYAVGQATAAAARAAGLAVAATGTGDAAGIVARADGDGCRRLLHLAGREHRPVALSGVAIGRATVYAADAVDALPPAAVAATVAGAAALLHSPRAAVLFGALLDAAGVGRATVALAALSPAVAAAAGPGWAAVQAAARPTDAALLAVAAKLCEGLAREA